ncbi:hypothetical protein Q3O60_07695 [Alkalimonas collagenimarina]|uniref:DUF945 family protein n=1 Tax=Alkalimonas collagenimarina TaxID=400390 RepID=A0ABT9GZF0_9GAMM|nr:hypothetical protein [Alkalimonas collagenimarina]MDP4536065.1 hypothetical protein [Alkalimonas collagenimarina]
MKLKIIIPTLLVVTAAASLVFVNYKASEAIQLQLQQVNQSYADMAMLEGLPALQLAHGTISANVLTSSYRIHDLQLSMTGLGELLAVDSVQLKGVKPNQLANKGSVEVNQLTVGSGALLFLPAELGAFIQSVQLHGDYRYSYNPNNESLWFSQHTRINDEFQFSYQFTFTQMQPLWQWLAEMTAMSAEQQQAVMASESYADEISDALRHGAVSHGEVHLVNDGFLQRLIKFTAANGQSPTMEALQGIAMMSLAMTDTVPAEFKQSLMSFIEQPESLTFSFQFEQPVSLADFESGSVWMELDSPEAMVQFSGARLVANQ